MARIARHLFVLSLLPALIAVSHAADAPAPLASEKSTATPTPPPKPKRERAISSNLAATLAAGMPKYNPPPKPDPEDEDVDLREVDKPRNGIIRLPKIVVQEDRPPVFRERDIYTKGGLADLAMRRYVTPTHRVLNRFYIPGLMASPEQYAMARFAEDERLANMADMNDTADTVSRADPEKGAYIRRATSETFMRSGDNEDYTFRNDR